MPNTSASGGYLTPTNSTIDDAALDAVFQALIVGLTGLDGALVRPRWQPVAPKMPEPSVNWVAIGVKDDAMDDNPSIQHIPTASGGSGKDELSRQEQIEVLATFYGPNAKGICKQVRDGMYIDQNREVIKTYGIVFVECRNIVAVPDLMNEQWVKRYDMPMIFRRTIIRDYAIENILTSGITLYNEQQVIEIEVSE